MVFTGVATAAEEQERAARGDKVGDGRESARMEVRVLRLDRERLEDEIAGVPKA
jgi:hypothetical protein